ncbi:MAG: hypothetical protein K6C14_02045 [Eubacterium sp.]|nr:hypothetical protein [Eubacterium sp.]
MKKASVIAFAGVAAALTFVLLYLGSVMWIFAYTAPLFCGLIIMVINTTFGKKYALSVFFAASVLGLLLSPDREASLVYTFFFGYYPIIKDKLELIKPKALGFIVKLIIFNLGIAASQLILIYVLGVPLDGELGKWGIPLFIVLLNVVFISYERLYGVMLKLYKTKFESRISNMLNK